MVEIARSRIAPPSLLPAPSALTPAIADALIGVADRLRADAAADARAYEGPYPILSHRTVAGVR